jgi:hypothetical protein
VLLTLVPLALVLNTGVAVPTGQFLAEAMPLSLKEVALVDIVHIEVIVSSIAVIVSILEHATVDEIFRFEDTAPVEITAVELANVYLLFVTHKEVFAIASLLAVNPLAFVLLAGGDDILNPNTILAALAELSFVDVAIVVLYLANAFNLIILPETFENITGLGNELADSILDHVAINF